MLISEDLGTPVSKTVWTMLGTSADFELSNKQVRWAVPREAHHQQAMNAVGFPGSVDSITFSQYPPHFGPVIGGVRC
jgi:hypothetical protein